MNLWQVTAYAAAPYATKLERRAKDNGNVDEQVFWEAEAAALGPR